MYESPIKVNNFDVKMSFEKMKEDKIGKAINDAAESIAKQFDRYVLRQVAKTGVTIDRDELVKALQYDRDQYDKGYNDGVKHGIEISTPTWIPVTERLPEIECNYLIVDEHGEVHEAEYFNGEWVDPIEEYCVWNSKYWMYLPEPPKEDEDD